MYVCVCVCVYVRILFIEYKLATMHRPMLSFLPLTRRNEGVLDCIALGVVAPYAVQTLNGVSVKRLHITHSTDCHSVLCITLD